MGKGYRRVICGLFAAAVFAAAAVVGWTRIKMSAYYLTHRGDFAAVAAEDEARLEEFPDEDYVGYYNAGAESCGGEDILSAAEDIRDCFGQCEIWRRDGYGLMVAVSRVPVGDMGKCRTYSYIYKDGEWHINVTVGYIG